MNTTISVIIPVYNTEKYLEKCINSVRNQTYMNIEIILVDDGSTDLSAQICDNFAELDSRIIVIHKKNGGLSSARNAGLAIATGEYIGFVDSDDYISPQMYEQLYSKITSNSISCNLYVRVDEQGNVFNRNNLRVEGEQLTSEQYFRELLLHIGDVSVCTKLFPKKLLEGLYFDEDRLNEDLLFMALLMPKIKEITFTGHVGYFYLTRPDSISSKYGKAIIDMVHNSVVIYELVKMQYPMLSKEAIRFTLYQHMAYLLMVPHDIATLDNELYVKALAFVRKKFIKNGLFNRYLTLKNKIVLFGQMICPRVLAKIYQRKCEV